MTVTCPVLARDCDSAVPDSPVLRRQDRIHEAEYGHDLQTCQDELDSHHKEHKVIDQFQVRLEEMDWKGGW